jgi:2-methylcitrate dehydratase PrpD
LKVGVNGNVREATLVNQPHGESSSAGSTARLAEFVSSLRHGDLPDSVVNKIELCLLDSIACVVFGIGLPSVATLIKALRPELPPGPSSIWGTAQKASPAMAALVNGTAAHSFQFDEVHTAAVLHPGSAVVPAVLALAEGSPKAVSGKELLTAIAAGYEVGLRIGLAANSQMFVRGLHAQGTIGPLAAAAAVAHLLQLSSGQVSHCLGLSASQAAGLMAVQTGAMAKGFHSGRAAQSGIYAGLLAANGFTGIADVLDAGFGNFFDALTGTFRPKPLADGLGEKWHLLEVAHKLTPAANANITAMEALGRIMESHAIGAGDIDGVEAFVSTNTKEHCGWRYDPSAANSVLAAQMNLHYCLAVMALDRMATTDQFTQARMRRSDIARFVDRVTVQIEPKFDAPNSGLRLAARIRVTCVDGRTFVDEVLHRKGSPKRPVTLADITEKFNSLVGPAVGDAQARRILDSVMNIEDCEDVRGLLQLSA